MNEKNERYVIRLKRLNSKDDNYVVWDRKSFQETPCINNATTFDLQELNDVRIALNEYALEATEWITYNVEEVEV